MKQKIKRLSGAIIVGALSSIIFTLIIWAIISIVLFFVELIFPNCNSYDTMVMAFGVMVFIIVSWSAYIMFSDTPKKEE